MTVFEFWYCILHPGSSLVNFPYKSSKFKGPKRNYIKKNELHDTPRAAAIFEFPCKKIISYKFKKAFLFNNSGRKTNKDDDDVVTKLLFRSVTSTEPAREINKQPQHPAVSDCDVLLRLPSFLLQFSPLIFFFQQKLPETGAFHLFFVFFKCSLNVDRSIQRVLNLEIYFIDFRPFAVWKNSLIWCSYVYECFLNLYLCGDGFDL